MLFTLQGCISFVRFASKDKEKETEYIDKGNVTITEIDPERTKSLRVLYSEEGYASYYSYEFHGKKTANGEIFDKDKPSAAHRTLPLGTIARVTNLKNGKSIILRINDRGPFKSGRILDVSYAAAVQLDFVKEGITKVRIDVLEYGDNKYYK
ncbi:MAG TPA: septal ring lytic transglycosylase RlpA family protein [Bacteroidota bacterium]|nr:septal ring lytic transglycosylase RlpA family protein [Bacteroidota bacterium]